MIDEPQIKHTYTLGKSTSAARSVAVTLGADKINPAQLIRNGVALAGYGEVSLEIDKTPLDSDHDRRYVILQGEVAGGVSFGAVRNHGEHEVIDLEVVDPIKSMDVRFPLWVVDESRFSTVLHVSAIGERIPVVFNGYDAIPAVRTNDVSGSREFMFAYNHGWTTTTPPIVYVNGVVYGAAAAPYQHVFVELTDGDGIPYTAVRFTNGATSWADGDSVSVSVTHDTQNLSVIDVIKDVCTNHSPLGVDGISQALFSTAQAKMGDFFPRVASNSASGSGASGALNWIEGGYLENFPMVSMVWDIGGYGPIVTDRRAAPVMELTVGSAPLLDRIGIVEEISKEELFNEWVIRYDYDPILDVFQKVVSATPATSAVCKASQDLLGDLHAPVLEALYIVDDDLASRVLNWLVEHLTLPSYFVQYEGFGRLFWEIRRGDTIWLTDPDFAWVKVAATVEEITYMRGRVVLGLRVWLQFVKLGGAAQNAPIVGL